MDERLKENIEMFRRVVPGHIKLYVADKGQSADIFAPTANISDKRKVEDAYEWVSANTNYEPRFTALPLNPKRMKASTKRFLTSCQKI